MTDDLMPGLNDRNRALIVTIVAVLLLLFGPIGPFGLLGRVAYLLAVPICLSIVLRFVGRRFPMEQRINNSISRTIVAAVGGALLVGAYQDLMARHHWECTQYVRDSDGGRDCVGDYVRADGADIDGAWLMLVFAGLAFWWAISIDLDDESTNS